jgi:hypothetical protein
LAPAFAGPLARSAWSGPLYAAALVRGAGSLFQVNPANGLIISASTITAGFFGNLMSHASIAFAPD